MSCLSPPPLDRDKPPPLILILLIVLFVLLLIVSAAGAASRGQADPDGSTLGYWGMCNPDGVCYSATLRYKHGDRTFADCAVAMWSVGTVLSNLLSPDYNVRTQCLRAEEPEPSWWRAMRKDESRL
jgi:hypothetical protein